MEAICELVAEEAGRDGADASLDTAESCGYWAQHLNRPGAVEQDCEDRREGLFGATPEVAPKAKSLLTRSWIYKHLKELNETTEPVVERRVFLGAYKEAIRRAQEEQWLHQPLEGIWQEVGWGVVKRLFWAKEERREEVGDRSERIPANVMDAPMLGQFLVAVNGFVHVKNETSLADWLLLEPPFSDHYDRMIEELKQTYPRGNEEALEKKCSQALPSAREGEDGAPWTQFIKFMVQYLSYLREIDADPNKYLQTYDLLSELQVRANSALTHATLGHLVLPVVVRCARLVCRLAIGLDRQPELIAHLKSTQAGGAAAGEDGGARETLPERAANTLRTGFVTCLNDRYSGIGKNGKPEGKKRGIYTIANLCLKILFQCRKTRNATQIFSNISNLSPPIAAYPKRERVTYLYYLGRFYFQNSHFYRAQHVLQHAYDESPANAQCIRQRRHILVYLIAANITLGRFPSEALLSRPEANGFAERFLPLCFAIRKGDLGSFRRHLDFDGEHADWFLHFRILLQLRNRCEVLVWRSLIRKVFLLAGTIPDMDGNHRAAPTVNVRDMVAAFRFLEKRAILGDQARGEQGYIDPDFAGLDIPPDTEMLLPDATALESILSSLLDQGLLGGFISHKQLKFAITGSKTKGGPLAAGFPNPWMVMSRKAEGEGQAANVPGWKKEGTNGGGPGPGMVINLSGARPVGAFG